MPPVKVGDVILAEFPIGSARNKRRPGIVLSIIPPYGDLLVCGVSRQLGRFVSELDEVIQTSDDDFGQSGLQFDSLIRLGYITTVVADEIDGIMGDISVDRLQRLQERLATFLTT